MPGGWKGEATVQGLAQLARELPEVRGRREGEGGAAAQGAPWRSKLKTLAERFLKRTIQTGSHDSIDDARAAMDLALLKIRCLFPLPLPSLPLAFPPADLGFG